MKGSGSEYKEIKKVIELFLRGKFLGGEFKFILYLSDTTILTNEDLFFDRVDILNLLVKNDIEKIVLKEQDTATFLIDRLYTSTSIIRISEDTQRDYQSYMITKITEIWERIQGVKKMIDIINKLNSSQIKLIVLCGLLDYSYQEISQVMKCSAETVRRKYKRAIEQCTVITELFND